MTTQDKMTHNEDTIMVFTARSPERNIAEGGSQAWRLKPLRARHCAWVVCTQNRHHPDPTFSDATEPHRCGFLVGKIAAIQKSLEERSAGRYMIAISHYALIHIPDLWDRGQNPVRYTWLDVLGIDPEGLDWQPMPQPSTSTTMLAWPRTRLSV